MSKTRSGIIYHTAERSAVSEIMTESETAGGSGSADEVIRLLMEDRKRQDEQLERLMRLMEVTQTRERREPAEPAWARSQ